MRTTNVLAFSALPEFEKQLREFHKSHGEPSFSETLRKMLSDRMEAMLEIH